MNNRGYWPIPMKSPLPLHFSKIFNRKTGRTFVKGKRNGENDFRIGGGFAHGKVFGKEENLGNQAWAMIKRSTSFRKKGKEVLEQVVEAAAAAEGGGGGGAEEGDEGGLCKKRILLGRRCKPLDLYGNSPYDLLP